MLEILNNKKIISIIIVFTILICIFAYVYYNNNTKNSFLELEKMEIDLSLEENNDEIINEKVFEKHEIAVHIAGEVQKTGIIYLQEGSRLADAITLAGGETIDANLSIVNLAYVLTDGEKIYIPNINDEFFLENENNLASNGNYINNQGSDTNISSNNDEKGGNDKVNINEANLTELETLPGIGPSLAQYIIDYRNENSSFTKIEDLQNVKGIGDAKYSDIKDQVCI